MDIEKAISYIKARCIGADTKRDGTQWSDAMWTAIEALTTIGKLEKLTNMYAQHGNKPVRTISMEDLKELLNG